MLLEVESNYANANEALSVSVLIVPLIPHSINANSQRFYIVMTNGLTLNICEVIFDKSEVPLPYCEYDEETFSYWRDQPGVFAYRWNDRIYLWQLAQDEGRQFPRTGTSLVTLDEDAPLFVKLIEQSLIAYLNALDYTIYRKNNIMLGTPRFKEKKANPLDI